MNPFAGILELVTTGDTRRCIECFRTKILDAFPRNKESAQGRRRICKDCFNRIQRAKRAADRSPDARPIFTTEAQRVAARRARQRQYYHENQARLKAKSLNRYYERKQS